MYLTTEWQILSTYRFEYSGFICEFYLEGKYTTQSKENNTTNVQFRLRSKVIRGQASGYGYYFRLDYAPSIEGTGLWVIKDETISSAGATITHNPDGTKESGVNADVRINGLGIDTTLSSSYKLPPISRYAILTTVSNFNDESNPTIAFTNSGLYDLRAKMLVGNTEIYSQDLQGNETSYTYDLTTNQRNQLRQLCTGKTLTVKVAICSIEDNQIVYTSNSDVIMNIVNATPTFTYTVQEQNSKVVAFLGTSSANSLIENVSVLGFTVVPTFYKYATFGDIWIGEIGGTNAKHITESPYTTELPIYSNNELYISLSDSRNFVATLYDENRTLLNYETVKINSYSFVRESPTSNNIKLNLESVYYDSVGGIQNTPLVKWKLDDGSYNTIPSSYYVIDTTNNTLKITNYELTNVLSYQSTGQFTIYIEDELSTVQDSGANGKVLKGIPTFDAGEHDLKVNGTLYIADTNGENKVDVLDKINELSGDKYSSTEQVVGTWTGGQTLYRIVFKSTQYFDTGNYNIGLLNNSYRMRYALATFRNANDNNEYTMSNSSTSIYHNAGNITVQFSSPWGNGELEAIVYYTK